MSKKEFLELENYKFKNFQLHKWAYLKEVKKIIFA
jgi:hypothetical protein